MVCGLKEFVSQQREVKGVLGSRGLIVYALALIKRKVLRACLFQNGGDCEVFRTAAGMRSGNPSRAGKLLGESKGGSGRVRLGQ